MGLKMIDTKRFHDALGNVWKMFPAEIVGMSNFQETVEQIVNVAIDLYNSQEEQRTYKEILGDIVDDLKKGLCIDE